MKIDWTRVPLLVLVIVLLLGGGIAYIREGEGESATALIAAGLVVLGALVAVEVIAWHHKMHKDDAEQPPDKTEGES